MTSILLRVINSKVNNSLDFIFLIRVLYNIVSVCLLRIADCRPWWNLCAREYGPVWGCLLAISNCMIIKSFIILFALLSILICFVLYCQIVNMLCFSIIKLLIFINSFIYLKVIDEINKITYIASTINTIKLTFCFYIPSDCNSSNIKTILIIWIHNKEIKEKIKVINLTFLLYIKPV